MQLCVRIFRFLKYNPFNSNKHPKLNSTFNDIEKIFKGRFLTPPADILAKFEKIKLIFLIGMVFSTMDRKDENNTSLFNEIDAMGINMLRFNHYQRKGSMPLFGIVTGEKNSAAHTFSDREHMDFVYYKIKHKSYALDHICKKAQHYSR